MTISKLELIVLSLILFLGTFFRLYHLRETAMFLGDQGRDAIIAKDIIKNGDIALIGPVTSVGNMYLGPFYYYFMALGLAFTYPDPIGPAVEVALVGIATIPLVFFITKKMFGNSSAWIATIIFTCSSIAIDQVRFSWNPNIAPTVGLLIFYLAYQLMREKKYTSIVWLAVAFAILIQLHYMALVVGLFISVPILYLFISQKKARSTIIKMSLIGLGLFFMSLIPLIAFDVRHEHLISEAFTSFFSSNQEHVLPAGKLIKIVTNFSGNLYKLLPQMLELKTQIWLKITTLMILVVTVYLYKKVHQNQKIAILISGLWLSASALLMSLYSSSIFIHYLSFSHAVSFVILGGLAGMLYEKSHWVLKIAIILAVSSFSMVSPSKSSAFSIGQSNIDTAKITSQSIVDRVKEGEKYNIVLISGTGDIDAQSYRYFLETSSKPPVKKEERGSIETLYIIQEDYFDQKVEDSPIYEIVVFPDKTPKEVYTIKNGPTVTVMKKS